MVQPDGPDDLDNSGRHRAPDGDAQTAFIPRITDDTATVCPAGPLATESAPIAAPAAWPPAEPVWAPANPAAFPAAPAAPAATPSPPHRLRRRTGIPTAPVSASASVPVTASTSERVGVGPVSASGPAQVPSADTTARFEAPVIRPSAYDRAESTNPDPAPDLPRPGDPSPPAPAATGPVRTRPVTGRPGRCLLAGPDGRRASGVVRRVRLGWRRGRRRDRRLSAGVHWVRVTGRRPAAVRPARDGIRAIARCVVRARVTAVPAAPSGADRSGPPPGHSDAEPR